MGPEHLVTAETIRALAELGEAQGADKEASDSYQRALALRAQAISATYSSRADAERHLIATLRAIGHFAEVARIETARPKEDPD
jgi:hypothetical protein